MPFEIDDTRFDALVGSFYRAATGEIDWNLALEGVQAAFGARASLLQTMDMATGQMLGLHYGGPDLGDGILSYVRDYQRMDPRRQHAQSLGAAGLERWVHCHEVFDETYRARDPFYRNYLPAYDIWFNSYIAFPVEGSLITGFILELPVQRGPLGADEREWAQRLGVQMKDALRAYERVRRLAAQALAGHGLLRSFAYPMWLIDADRYIHFANEAADRETRTEACFARRGARLVSTRNKVDVALTERLLSMRGAAHGSRATVDLRRSGADAPAWLHLSLIVPEAVLGVFGPHPLVLATLFDPQHVSALDPCALTNMLGLTPAQSKVAVRLADGATAEQIAATNGCTVATVRSHVREVLQRLGVQRIADVMRLLRQGEPLWSAHARHGG